MDTNLNKKTLKALKRVKRLFSSAPRWIKGSYNRTETIRGRDTECYCLVGAFRRAADSGNDNKVLRNLITIAGQDPSVSSFTRRHTYINRWGVGSEARITEYNDAKSRTFQQVTGLIDRMVVKLEAKVNAEA
jgi:hypothetical protein